MNNGFLARFMRGRYGSDQLNIFLAVILLALGTVSLFADSLVLRGFQLMIFGVFMFRFLSRGIYKRRAENIKFLALSAPVTKYFGRIFRQLKDKDNRYFKCPKCSARLRVPRGRGSITVTCPACRHKFDKRT